MRTGTSGLLFTMNKDGSIIIEVIDYNVSEFGGNDYENRYDLDKVNAEVLYKELKRIHNGSFEEMLIAEFDNDFNTLNFECFCKIHNIIYSHSTWF